MRSSRLLPGGVRGVIFDISGTVLDYGSRGPVVAFVELFSRHGVTVTDAEARKPMGMQKKDHIWAMLTATSIGERWSKVHGAAPTQTDLDKLYEAFTPLQIEVLPRHCDVIPGVPDVVRQLRGRGIKIANTTGFDTSMMRDLIPLAGQGGYAPDVWVCPDQAGGGRPAPWMAHYAARQLNIYPMSAFVKVGDTCADVEEAHAAGMWAVSVVRHGNEVGLSREAVEAMPPAELAQVMGAARARLAACGPHYIIDRTADLIPVIDEISARIVRGEHP
jgi:phosphonoacetaldehyde hydrolase